MSITTDRTISGATNEPIPTTGTNKVKNDLSRPIRGRDTRRIRIGSYRNHIDMPIIIQSSLPFHLLRTPVYTFRYDLGVSVRKTQEGGQRSRFFLYLPPVVLA